MITKQNIMTIYMTALKVSFKYIPLLIVRSLAPAIVIAIVTFTANEQPIATGILYLILLVSSFIAATIKRLFLAKELIRQIKYNDDVINEDNDNVDITKDSDMIITILILLMLLIIASYTLTNLSIISAVSFSIVILFVSLLAKLI